MISNWKIIGIKTRIEKDFTTTVKLKFLVATECRVSIYTKRYYNVANNEKFQKIVFFAGVEEVKNLKGRVFRGVMSEDDHLIGVGDAIVNNFVLFSDMTKSYTKEELDKMFEGN